MSEALRSHAEEVLFQLRNALNSSSDVSIGYGGLSGGEHVFRPMRGLFLILATLGLAWCFQGGKVTASPKDQPPENWDPPVSEKPRLRPPPEASPSNCCFTTFFELNEGACCILPWARRKGENRKLPSPVTTGQDESRHRIIGFVPKPPEDYVDADGHVNFTGSWKCKSADGDLDRVFADMGIGIVGRTLMAAYGWGKGNVVRTYEQSGIHVRLIEKAMAMHERVQEFDVNGQEQTVNGGDFYFLQTSYWDAEKPHVLRWTTADLAKAEPSKWTRNCLFFSAKDQLRIETTSSSGKVAYWIYERIQM